MLNTITSRGLFAASLLALAGSAFAQATPQQAVEQRVNNREARQEQRIDQGIQSGALTAPEARRLGREQAGIERAETRAEADGRISRREAVKLERRQDRASAHIAHAKHDRQTRKP